MVARVTDPHQFNADPDLAFYFNAVPDPAFHFNSDSDPDRLQSDVNVYRPCRAPF
jgi:hypothetical protein